MPPPGGDGLSAPRDFSNPAFLKMSAFILEGDTADQATYLSPFLPHFFFHTGTHSCSSACSQAYYVADARSKLLILLPAFPECWWDRHVSPHLAMQCWGSNPVPLSCRVSTLPTDPHQQPLVLSFPLDYKPHMILSVLLHGSFP